MRDPHRYQNEQDLIFQQIEEQELRERQALVAAEEALRGDEKAEYVKMITRLSRAKAFQKLMAVSAPSDRVEIVRAITQAWKERRERLATPL